MNSFRNRHTEEEFLHNESRQRGRCVANILFDDIRETEREREIYV